MIDLQNASRVEMMEYARETLGINVSPNIGDDKLREKIQAHVAGMQTAKPVRAGEKMIRIVIDEKEGDEQPVFVGVNGRTFNIKRGVEVDVPECVVDVLRNAREDKFNPKTMQKKSVLSYPFQVMA